MQNIGFHLSFEKCITFIEKRQKSGSLNTNSQSTKIIVIIKNIAHFKLPMQTIPTVQY